MQRGRLLNSLLEEFCSARFSEEFVTDCSSAKSSEGQGVS